MEQSIQWNADDRHRIVVRMSCVHNSRSGNAQTAWCGRLSRSSIAVRSHSNRWWSPMVTLRACPWHCEVVVWASHWRRGRSENAIGLTKIAHQSAVRAQNGPYCSHTEERFSYIRWPHGDLVDFLGCHGRSVVAVLCDGGLKAPNFSCHWIWISCDQSLWGHIVLPHFWVFIDYEDVFLV